MIPSLITLSPGAIYLYLGSKSGGVLKTPSQTISPSNLNILDNVRGFGWAISAGKDMDGNGYPDVLVGAHKSNHAGELTHTVEYSYVNCCFC